MIYIVDQIQVNQYYVAACPNEWAILAYQFDAETPLDSQSYSNVQETIEALTRGINGLKGFNETTTLNAIPPK